MSNGAGGLHVFFVNFFLKHAVTWPHVVASEAFVL
jgi:hypothetical protein